MLPAFIAPMLPKLGQAFDSDRFLYEVKWDGTRTLAYIERGADRLVNRRRHNTIDRYPEFGFLSRLPSGTVLDGEIVVLKDGQPDFAALVVRELLQSPFKIQLRSGFQRATYIVFDLLYLSHRSLMSLPLEERRAQLARLVQRHPHERLIFSEGFVGQGVALFQEICRRGLEGVVAKRLGSEYRPGARNGAWQRARHHRVSRVTRSCSWPGAPPLLPGWI
jgi:ATP-dependent DNA ligase